MVDCARFSYHSYKKEKIKTLTLITYYLSTTRQLKAEAPVLD